MLNPVFMPIAFMGGRSWGEIMDCDQTKAMDSSIQIGVGAVVSAVIIFFGQRLFWQSIPSTAEWATPLAWVLTLVYAFFYRLLIRASEVTHVVGKAILASLGFCLAGVNAMLAGHELVLLPFGPQVQEMMALTATQNVGNLRSETENALGMGHLRQDTQQARTDATQARQRLQTVPVDVQALQKQAENCLQQSQRMQATMPEPEAAHYATSFAQWGEQRKRCVALQRTTDQTLAQHRAQAQKDLAAANLRQQAADQKLAQAQTESDTVVGGAAPALTQSATTGFGRHKALWAAVDAGKIPAWAAYGLMLVALMLEAAGLLLKWVLPKDESTYARVAETRITSAMGEGELAYTQAFRRQIKPVIRDQTAQMQADARRLVQNVLAPGMNTRFAADQFARAARATRRAQQRSRQAATPVIDELSRVMSPGMAAGSV